MNIALHIWALAISFQLLTWIGGPLHPVQPAAFLLTLAIIATIVEIVMVVIKWACADRRHGGDW